jgi:hypothetical protein
MGGKVGDLALALLPRLGARPIVQKALDET